MGSKHSQGGPQEGQKEHKTPNQTDWKGTCGWGGRDVLRTRLHRAPRRRCQVCQGVNGVADGAAKTPGERECPDGSRRLIR